MDAAGHARIAAELDPGCWWLENDRGYIYLPLDADDRKSLANGVQYAVTARNGNAGYRCELASSITRE